MRVHLVVIGRMKSGPETELLKRYFDRAQKSGKQVGLEFAKIIEHTESKLPSATARQTEEAEKIRTSVPPHSTLICLDERGENMSSQKFSDKIRDIREDGSKIITFVIGGPDGLAEELRRKSNSLVAFGKMTYPHMIMRVLLMEQLYRAVTIQTGHPYHRE